MTPQECLAAVLAAATTTQCVAAVTSSHSENIRWANSTPTTNGDTSSRHLTITAVAEVPDGWAAGTRTGRPEDWRTLLAAAEADARAGAPAREGNALPAGAGDGFVDPAFDQPEGTAGAGVDLAALAAAFADPSWRLFGYAEQEVSTTYVATSTGTRLRLPAGDARFELSAKTHDFTRSAWHGAAGQHLAEIDVDAAVADVRAGLAAQEHRLEVAAEPRTVVLTPSAVADLMIIWWWNAQARDAAEGHSPFSDARGPAGTAIGRRLSGRRLQLRSDPAAPGLTSPDRLWVPWSGSAATVFDTGVSIRGVDWIDNGVLASLAATRAGAAELGLPVVVSAENLILTDAAGSGSLAEVIARTDDALLITSLWYLRDVDPQTMLVTGLTRDGCYGIREGRLLGAAGNFRFNDSPLMLLDRIVDAGASVRCLPREWADDFTRTVMPPLTIRDFGLSTPSVAV